MSNEQNPDVNDSENKIADDIISNITNFAQASGKKIQEKVNDNNDGNENDSDSLIEDIKKQGLEALQTIIKEIIGNISDNKAEINSHLNPAESNQTFSLSLNPIDIQFQRDDKHTKITFVIKKELDLKYLKFSNFTLTYECTKDEEDFNVITQLLATFIADIKGVTLTISGFGIKVEPQKTSFIRPAGIGVSIDIGPVKGTGAINWDDDKQRFSSMVGLNILEKFKISSLIAFTTGNGSDPASFLGVVNTELGSGIPIGMGFSITGIGGSLGVERGLDVDNLTTAVYDGSLPTILFVKEIEKNFDRVLANIDKYYPIRNGQMYFGILAQISWKEILTADVGLFIQAPDPVTIVLAGVIKVHISDSSESLLVIKADFIGGIQFDKGIFFDASLYDSKIVGIDLLGDTAMRIYWGGQTKGFILTVGGFHPQYKPESGFNLPDLKRVGLKLDYKIVNFSLDAYFAITSNTVQFGTSMFLRIGWEKFGLTGNAAFNALFQFNPFMFTVDMSAGLAVKIGSLTLFSISLAFELSGPAQWHAKGSASFWFLLLEINVDFDYTWGKKQVTSDKTSIDIFPLFSIEFDRQTNWSVISSDLTDNMVTLQKFPESDLIVSTNDTIIFNQSTIPLNRPMDCYGESSISDFKEMDLNGIYIGEDPFFFENETASFAPSLIQNMDKKSDSEKLSMASYENMDSGFKITGNGEIEIKGTLLREEDKNLQIEPIKEDSNEFRHWKAANKSTKKTDIYSSLMKISSLTKEMLNNINEINKKNQDSSNNSTTTKNNKFNIQNRLSVLRERKQSWSSENNQNRESILKTSYRRNTTGIERFIKQVDQLIKIDSLNLKYSNAITFQNNGSYKVKLALYWRTPDNPEKMGSFHSKVLAKGEGIRIDLKRMLSLRDFTEVHLEVEIVGNNTPLHISKQLIVIRSSADTYCSTYGTKWNPKLSLN